MNSPNPYFYNVTRTLTLHDHKKKLQNDWNSLGFINILKYWMIMKFTKPVFLLSDSSMFSPCSRGKPYNSLLKWTFFSHGLAGDSGRIFGHGRWEGILANFRLSHQKFRAIDLSCRACGAGAGCWAWIPGRGTCGVHSPHPILDFAKPFFASPPSAFPTICFAVVL